MKETVAMTESKTGARNKRAPMGDPARTARAVASLVSRRRIKLAERAEIEARRRPTPDAPDSEDDKRRLAEAMLADESEETETETAAVRAEMRERDQRYAAALARLRAEEEEIAEAIQLVDRDISEIGESIWIARKALEMQVIEEAAQRLDMTLERHHELVDQLLDSCMEVACYRAMVASNERDRQTPWMSVELPLAGLGERGYTPPPGFIADGERVYFCLGGSFTMTGGNGMDIAIERHRRTLIDIHGGVDLEE